MTHARRSASTRAGVQRPAGHGPPEAGSEAEAAPAGRAAFAVALLLLALAGAVDAIAFVYLDGLFVSFMSGNTTEAALALADRRLENAARIGAVVGAFVVGVVVGEVAIGDPPRRAAWLLLAEAFLVAAAASALPGAAAGWLLAFAMGVHNALVLRVGRIGVALTFVTGTLVRLGRGLAARLARRKERPPVLPYLAMWTALAAGAVAGGAGARLDGRIALFVVAGLLGLCAAADAFLGLPPRDEAAEP